MSVCCVSAGATECVTPDSPPIVNIETTPIAKSIAALNLIRPPHIVAIQLRIFTPVGTAINIVDSEKAATETGPIPDTNIW